VTVIDRESGGWLGKYDLIAELPQEETEDVYLAASVAPGGYTKLAVIRVLRPSPNGKGGEDDDLSGRFMEAARVAARLKHANIVETLEVARGPARSADEAPGPGGSSLQVGLGEPYVASEYIEGQSLAKVIERVGPAELGRGMWLRVLVDALAGLHHAHEALDDAGAPMHLAHLHLAPSEVMVSYDGQVKVLDFGRVEARVGPESGRSSESLVRSAPHLAPEQASGKPADRRADIFAVGTMLWAASTRLPLWGDLDGAGILSTLTNGKIPSLREVDPNVPPPLADIVGRALALNPDDRYSTAMHLQADLEGFLRASGDNPAPREIGRLVAHAFLEERLRTTTIVDEQLRRLRARAISSGEGRREPVSLLRLEARPPVSSRNPILNVPTSVRSFRPVPAAPRSVGAPSPAAAPSRARSARAGVWIAAAAAVVAAIAALALANAR
jgi:serine/threonine-protein kinase